MKIKEIEGDTLMECNNKWWSMKRILGDEEHYNMYKSSSLKLKEILELKVFLDLSAVELAFARLDKLSKESKELDKIKQVGEKE